MHLTPPSGSAAELIEVCSHPSSAGAKFLSEEYDLRAYIRYYGFTVQPRDGHQRTLNRKATADAKTIKSVSGGAIKMPFRRYAPFFLPLIAIIFMILPFSAHAQIWVSSGFQPGADAQHATAYCSTSAIDPATGKVSPAATDYQQFYTDCVVSGSDGSSFPGNPAPCTFINGWASGNPTALCTFEFPLAQGVSYVVNAFHYVVFNDGGGDVPFASVPLCNKILANPNIYSVVCTDALESINEGVGDPGVAVSQDPEGFISIPPAYTPIYNSTKSSITEKIVGSGVSQLVPVVFDLLSYTNMCSQINNMSFNICTPSGSNIWLEDQSFADDWTPAFTSAQYCPTPTITSISPNVWFAGQSYNITITGTGFTTPAAATSGCAVSEVSVSAPQTNPDVTIAVSNVNVVSGTEITATVSPTSAPNTGPPLKGGTPSLAGATGATVQVFPTPPPQTGPAPALAAKATPTAAAAAPAPNVDVLLDPQIVCSGSSMQCNGKVISGGAAPATAIVGQTIMLTTTPDATELASLPIPLSLYSPSNWTVGGTNIGARVLGARDANDNPTSASFSSTVLTDADLTTYWLYPGANIPVTYEYCAQNESASPATVICSTQATAYFNVEGPTAQITASLSSASSPPATGAWWVSPENCGSSQTLSFGILESGCVLSTKEPGIVFSATDIVNVPPSGGVFAWLQVLDAWEISGTAPTGVTPNYPIKGLTLDTSDPYPAIPTTSLFETEDAPTTGLNTPGLTTETMAFTATMYLLWSSNIDPDSINVPIGYVTWNINGVADNSPKATPPWSLDKKQGPTTANYWSSSDSTGPSPGLPVWSAIFNSLPASSSASQLVLTSPKEESQSVQIGGDKEQDQ